VVRRDYVELWSPAIGAEGGLLAYGHHGRPLLVFQSEQGRCSDYEDRGMIDAVAGLIEAGRLKVYSVDSYDAASWCDPGLPLEARAERHGRFEQWILDQVVPFIYDDSQGPLEIMVTGASFGAYHAANFAFHRADLFPLAICQSGVYDAGRLGWGERGDALYFNNPMDYVANLHGDHLDWLRGRLSLLLVCGQGQWEDTTGALESTKAFDRLLTEKGIKHETDLWGHDVPHDWPSWRAQLAHHLPRFV
jgi:esterase/lipase superfamily enzyme